MNRLAALLPGVLAFAMPAPPAQAEGIAVPFCGDPALTVIIPLGNAPVPGQPHDCCRGLACHAACERKEPGDGGDDDGDDGGDNGCDNEGDE